MYHHTKYFITQLLQDRPIWVNLSNCWLRWVGCCSCMQLKVRERNALHHRVPTADIDSPNEKHCMLILLEHSSDRCHYGGSFVLMMSAMKHVNFYGSKDPTRPVLLFGCMNKKCRSRTIVFLPSSPIFRP